MTSSAGRSAAAMSARTRTRVILSGAAGGSPFSMASTAPSPWITRPQTVKVPSSAGAIVRMTNNWLLALSGLS